MASESRDFLLVFGDQAKILKDTKVSTLKSIEDEFHKLFPDQINSCNKYLFQRWDDQWNSWIDIVYSDDLDIPKSACKIRLIPKECNVPRLGNLSPETSAFLCCDMQERFKPAILYFDEIANVCSRLLKGAYLLDIPVIVTEQYPKGLLHTVPELDISGAKAVVEKTVFSMMVPEVKETLKEHVKSLQSVILFGVEAHVCIQQTAIDLLACGVEVHVIADACSSRSQVDRILAFERLREHGAIITTAETVLLQLVKDKNHPKFKEMQNIIKILPSQKGILCVQSAL